MGLGVGESERKTRGGQGMPGYHPRFCTLRPKSRPDESCSRPFLDKGINIDAFVPRVPFVSVADIHIDHLTTLLLLVSLPGQ